MFTPTSQFPEWSDEPYDPTDIADVLGLFGNWLLDLVSANGVSSIAGYSQWHQTPIDLWVMAQGYTWEWADRHPVIREYRRLIEAVHNKHSTAIPAYEALAILSLLKTLIRYRMA